MASNRALDAVAVDYQSARAAGDRAAMARSRNEEACVVLLTLLGRLAADDTSFVHDIAIKGGILMAGELQSPRVSADIDATSGAQKRVDPERIVRDLRRLGRDLDVRQYREPDRTHGGTIVHVAFVSGTDAGTAKIEISVREDLVFAVREAFFDVSSLGLEPYSVPALAEVEIVAEKLRTLVQRAQPRDLFDLRLLLTGSGWHIDPGELRTAVDRKLSATRHRRWKPSLWRSHLDDIEPIWASTLEEWMPPRSIPSFTETVEDVSRRLRELDSD